MNKINDASLHDLLKNNLETIEKRQLRAHGIPLKGISAYLGLSYSHTCSILNGYRAMSPKVKSRLLQLINILDIEAELGGK